MSILDRHQHHRRRRHPFFASIASSSAAAQPSSIAISGSGVEEEGLVGGDNNKNPLSELFGRLNLPFIATTTTTTATTKPPSFRPSARFLSSRLGRAWLEQLESQRALLTGAAGAAARAAGAADAAGRARLADARATLGAQLAWDRAKAEWLASQLLEAGENGILNPANVVLDAYVAGKARYYLRRHALRTAAVLSTACLLIDALKAGAARVARGAAARSKLVSFVVDSSVSQVQEELQEQLGEEEEEKRRRRRPLEQEELKEGEATETAAAAAAAAAAPPPRPRSSSKRRAAFRFLARGAIALTKKAVDAALPTPLLAAWLVAELML